jgi:oligopeptide/dipeptide ABC transporter ATP-binding protein
MLFITHDLDLAAAVTDRFAVMYAGSVVETGPSSDVCASPKHPYTAALLASRPSLLQMRRLQTIPGRPLSASEAGEGCVFASRCSFAQPKCASERPATSRRGNRSVSCHFADDLAPKLQEMVAQ